MREVERDGGLFDPEHVSYRTKLEGEGAWRSLFVVFCNACAQIKKTVGMDKSPMTKPEFYKSESERY